MSFVGSLNRAACRVLAVSSLAGLVACSTPVPPRFHTLMPAPGAATAPAASLAWQVNAVQVPAQVDQPQFVVRRADGTLTQLELERWAAPLQDEIRAALVEHFSSRVGPPLATPGRKDWRIGVDVLRFDSTPGRASLAVQWTLARGGNASGDAIALRCRSQFERAVDPGIAPLATGHRQMVERLAETILPVLRALDAGQAGTCPTAS